MKNKAKYKIPHLPDDNIRRMAHLPGAVFFNTINASIPIVEIPFVTLIKVDGREQLSNEFKRIKIGVSQLDNVKYGSIYEGQHNTGEIWARGKGYRENTMFTFDFDKYPPTSIPFMGRKEDGNYYIYRNKCNFDFIEDKGIKARFLQSQLTKLTTFNGVSVLIPALEVLSSIISPFEQSLRNKLLTNHIDDIVVEYLKSYTLDKNSYTIEYNNQKTKKDTNSVLLAYMAMHNISRHRLSVIRSSIVEGDRNTPKYPTILPFHPHGLQLAADGIWMNNKIFLCLRIHQINMPSEYKVKVHIERDKETEKKESDEPMLPPTEIEEIPFDMDDLGITHDNNPGNDTRRVYTTSDVIVSGLDGVVSQEVIYNEDDTPPGEKGKPSEEEAIPIEVEAPEDLSTGDQENTADAKGTAKLEHQENIVNNPEERVNESHLFTMIIQTLTYLTQQEENLLHSFSYLDDNGRGWDSPKLCNFLYPETKYRKAHTKWAYKVYNRQELIFIPRGALLLELCLINGKKAYLLEIEQKNSRDSYAGIIFNVQGSFTKDEIKNFLVEIAKNKGVVRQQKNNSLQPITLKHVLEYIPYTHYRDKDEETYIDIINNLIGMASENIFL